MAKPKNVILIVADSLRFDSVYRDGGPGIPYIETNSTQFTNARSSGCWTLPATCSMFTGMLPHEHGATSQSRWLDNKVPTLPGKLKSAGYKPIQVSANIVTTDVFNVAKDFDESYRTWDFVATKHRWILRFALAMNRPRVRRIVLKPKDKMFDRLSADLRQGIVWAQKTSHDAISKARERIAEHNKNGQGVFMFINLMETHYPYHIADTFALMSKGLLNRIHEWKVLYHFLSQSFLKNDKGILTQADLDLLRAKQQLGWQLIRNDIDNFCREMHEGQDNLVIFCSDHGDNFGEQGWQYHFSNVTDAGNRVPYFWMDHQHGSAQLKTHNVSSRFMHQDILRACGVADDGPSMFDEQAENMPFMQSFWYDNEGQTLDKYKYNQAAFIHGDKRFVLRGGRWMYAPVASNGAEPKFEFVDDKFNPLEELQLPQERKRYLEEKISSFNSFSDFIMSKPKAVAE